MVNCAGAWSRCVARMAKVELPVEVHRMPTCLFRRPEEMGNQGPIISDGVNRVYLLALGDSVLRVAHFGWASDLADPDTFDETVRPDQVGVLQAGLQSRFSVMRRSICWGGFSALYDMTPDGHPIVGKIAEIDGFWCNCGWSGNGFAGAPVVGKSLAQMILGESCDIDMSLFTWPRRLDVNARADLQWIHR